MDKFSINDWLTIQTRKDLLLIRRDLTRETINYAIFTDLLIALLSFCLDHVLWSATDGGTAVPQKLTPAWYWLLISALLIVAPAIIFIYMRYKKSRYQADYKKTIPVEDLVDLFDNEICYNVMTADAMRDHMLSKIKEEILQFYIIETAYYTNKATTQLFYFKNQGQKAIQTKKSLGGISYVRFLNVCTIIFNIYKELICSSRKSEEYKLLLEDSREYIDNFNDLMLYMSRNVPELRYLREYNISL